MRPAPCPARQSTARNRGLRACRSRFSQQSVCVCGGDTRAGTLGDLPNALGSAPAWAEVAAGHGAKAQGLQQTETARAVRGRPRGGEALLSHGLSIDTAASKDEKENNQIPVLPLEERRPLPSGTLVAVFESGQQCRALRREPRGAAWAPALSPPSQPRELPLPAEASRGAGRPSRSGTPTSRGHSLMNAAGWLCCCSASGGGKTLDMAMSTMPWHSSA